MAQTPHVELVAMAPSGETFLARDPEGVLLLFAPTGPAVAVDDATVDRAVAAGFDRVEASFASWPELDRERQRRAGFLLPDVRVDVTGWNVGRVRRTVARMGSWVDQGRTASARRVLHELLRATPALEADPSLLATIADLLDRIDEEERVVLPFELPPERLPGARGRMYLAVA